MTARELRKKSLLLRTRAIAEPNSELQASYRAMANVYDALARMLDEMQRQRTAPRLLRREPL